MIEKLVEENLDMIVGTRNSGGDSYRFGHQLGNRLFNKILKIFFKSTLRIFFQVIEHFQSDLLKLFLLCQQVLILKPN